MIRRIGIPIYALRSTSAAGLVKDLGPLLGMPRNTAAAAAAASAAGAADLAALRQDNEVNLVTSIRWYQSQCYVRLSALLKVLTCMLRSFVCCSCALTAFKGQPSYACAV